MRCLPVVGAGAAARRSGSPCRAVRVRASAVAEATAVARSATQGFTVAPGVASRPCRTRGCCWRRTPLRRMPPERCVAVGAGPAEAVLVPCATALPGASTELRVQGHLARRVASGFWTQEVTVTCPTRFGGCPRGVAEAASRRAFAWRVMRDVPKIPRPICPLPAVWPRPSGKSGSTRVWVSSVPTPSSRPAS